MLITFSALAFRTVQHQLTLFAYCYYSCFQTFLITIFLSEATP